MRWPLEKSKPIFVCEICEVPLWVTDCNCHWLWWPPNHCWINSLHWLSLYSNSAPTQIQNAAFKEEVKIFISKPLINHWNWMCIQGHLLSHYERFKALVNLRHMARDTPQPPHGLLMSVIHSSTIRKQTIQQCCRKWPFHGCCLSWRTWARCLPNALLSLFKIACKYN